MFELRRVFFSQVSRLSVLSLSLAKFELGLLVALVGISGREAPSRTGLVDERDPVGLCDDLVVCNEYVVPSPR